MTSETIWRNGHGFRVDPEASARLGQPYVDCKKCGTRADALDARRPCIGAYVHVPPSGRGLVVPVTVRPKGRKPITEDVWLDIDALGELVDLLRQFPEDHRGHAHWHWRNPDSDYPCSTCPSPLGDQARRLEESRRTAIDVEPAPAKLPESLPSTSSEPGALRASICRLPDGYEVEFAGEVNVVRQDEESNQWTVDTFLGAQEDSISNQSYDSLQEALDDLLPAPT